MALMNRRLDQKMETVFMMPAESYSYVSSKLVKEVFQLGGRVTRPRPARGGAAPAGEVRAAARARWGGCGRSEEARGRSRSAVPRLSRRVRRLEVSPTVAMSQRAGALKARGVRVLDFSVGRARPADAAPRGGGGQGGDRRGEDEVHAGRRAAGAAGGGGRTVPAGLRRLLRSRGGGDHGGREAGALPDRPGPLRPRPGGDRPVALLADLPARPCASRERRPCSFRRRRRTASGSPRARSRARSRPGPGRSS